MTMDDEKDRDMERTQPTGEQARDLDRTQATGEQDRDMDRTQATGEQDRDMDRTQATGKQARGHATATYPDDSRGGFDILGDGELASIKDRWEGVQGRFVDDPSAAARQADTIVGEVLDHLQRRHRELHDEAGRQTNGQADTEALRVQFLGYRSFLRTLLG